MNGMSGTETVGEQLNDEETLRGQRARARWPCCDYGQWGVLPGMLVPPEEAQDDLSGQNPYTGRPLAPLPVPAVALDGFEVRLGEGWGGSLHDLAEGMELLRTSEAAMVLLSCIGFVEEGVRGTRGAERLLGRLGLLKGAVMSAGTAVRLPGISIMMDSGRWDGPYLKRLGR